MLVVTWCDDGFSTITFRVLPLNALRQKLGQVVLWTEVVVHLVTRFFVHARMVIRLPRLGKCGRTSLRVRGLGNLLFLRKTPSRSRGLWVLRERGSVRKASTYERDGKVGCPGRCINGTVERATSGEFGDGQGLVLGVVEEPNVVKNGSGGAKVGLCGGPASTDLRCGDAVTNLGLHAGCNAADVDGWVACADKNRESRVSEFVCASRDTWPGRARVGALKAERLV